MFVSVKKRILGIDFYFGIDMVNISNALFRTHTSQEGNFNVFIWNLNKSEYQHLNQEDSFQKLSSTVSNIQGGP